MKKQYKIQLPKGKKVTMTNVDFEDGVMTVNVELENRTNFHEAIHNEVCGVFAKINNEWKEVLKANGVTREKIEEMAKESIKELEKDCPDIWNKMIQEYGEAICGKKVQKYEPKDGDFVKIEQEGKLYFTPDLGIGYSEKEPSIGIFKSIETDEGKELLLCYITLMRDSQYEILMPLEHEGRTFSVGELSNLKVSPATEEEKKLLINKLAEKGKLWNEKTKRIEDVRWRAEVGETFYYIDSNFCVNSMVRYEFHYLWKKYDSLEEKLKDERFNNVEYMLWEKGNYFKTREAAEKVAEQIRNIFKNSKSE